MPNFFVRGSKTWGILNSWWILLSFVPFGLTSFIAFLYVGFKAKNLKWKIFGCVYLSVAIIFFNVPLTDVWLAIFLFAWITSVIHSIKIRSTYLGYLKGLNTKLKASETRFIQQGDQKFTERNETNTLNKSNKSINEIFEIITLNGTERNARKEIRKQIIDNPSTLNLIKKAFESTGSFKHPLLISFKEKVLLKLRTQNDFNKLEDIEIKNYIEDEVFRYLRNNSKLKVRTKPTVKRKHSKNFIRRFPSVFFTLLALICIHILTNINGNGSADIDTALRFGAIESGDNSPDQWVRLASYIFVQMGGTIHLLVYMVAIVILAPPLERIYGSVKFTLLFLVTGIIGGYIILTSSIGVVSGSAIVSIYGLVGIHIGLLLKKNQKIHSENKRLIWVGIIGIILFTFIESSLLIAAHLGGFFSGLILSFLVSPQSFKRLSKTNWYLAIFQTVMVSAIVFLLLGLPRYVPELFSSFGDLSKSGDNGIQASFNESEAETETINQVKTIEENPTETKGTKKEMKAEVNTGHNDYDQTIVYLHEGKPELAIKQLKKVSKKSDKYKEAQIQIKTIERNLYLEGAKEINYKELQKSPDSYKGDIINLYGKIYNIQEVNGKTILTLSTTQDNYEVNTGDEALILFPKTTSLNKGDYIHIYGEMLGNYSSSQQKIDDYLKANQYTIYFDQRTFIEQAPVLKTKIIVDINGNMYE